MRDLFDLTGRVVVITGGLGLLGRRHAEVAAELGANVVLLDPAKTKADWPRELAARHGVDCLALRTDVTDEGSVATAARRVIGKFGRVDVLINNAAINPKVEANDKTNWSRLESYPRGVWDQEIAVGLTGAFLCARIFGAEMARRGSGVILNIASDLALIGPDQRLYSVPGLPRSRQPVKPVTYSVIKSGLIGLTRYLATYWADAGIRCNAISPGGVEAGQSREFLKRISRLIPLGRMARSDEYKGAVAFLISDASSYMTGTNLTVDGGRTTW